MTLLSFAFDILLVLKVDSGFNHSIVVASLVP